MNGYYGQRRIVKIRRLAAEDVQTVLEWIRIMPYCQFFHLFFRLFFIFYESHNKKYTAVLHPEIPYICDSEILSDSGSPSPAGYGCPLEKHPDSEEKTGKCSLLPSLPRRNI